MRRRPLPDARSRRRRLAELGAMRVPVSHRTFWRYADAFGLQRSPFPDPGAALTGLYFQGEYAEWSQSRPLPEKFKNIQNDFTALIKPYLEEIYRP